MGPSVRRLTYTRPVLSVLGTRTGGGGSAISSTFPMNTAADVPAPRHGVLAGPAQEQPSRRTVNNRTASTSRTSTFSQIRAFVVNDVQPIPNLDSPNPRVT